MSNGWKVVLTPGFEESPDAQVERFNNTSGSCFFFYPCGYEVYPGFLTNAKAAMASNDSISVVGGHIEIVDNGTGRVTTMRVYGGEMPSMALLSSRVFPKLCLLKRDIFTSTPVDPRSRNMYFEVFARECAINREGIVIIPGLAGRLNSLYAGSLETTKRISAGIYDETGMQRDYPARLLTVDPVVPPDEAEDGPYVMKGGELNVTNRLNPVGKVRDWGDPVAYRSEIGGLLVHPLSDDIVVAEIRGPVRSVRLYEAEVCNTHHDNSGAEAAIAIVPNSATIEDILDFVTNASHKSGYLMSAWKFVGPQCRESITLHVSGVSHGNDRILLMSRLPKNALEYNCHLTFMAISCWFDRNLI